MAKTQLWIGGTWCDGPSALEVRDPYTGAVIAPFSVADAALLQRASEAAHTAFSQCRRLPAHERADVLHRTAAGLNARAEEFAQTIRQEAGKPISLARAEVTRAIATFTLASEEARRPQGEWVGMDAFPAGRGHFGIARRFPIGSVLAITPFNFPLNLVAHKVAPCLATGNTMVLKPSPKTPLTAALLAEVLEGAGVPAGQVNLVICSNDAATALVEDPRFAMVSFTGSATVGWSLKAKVPRKKVLLELGGNAAVIIHDDADLERAVPLVASGAFAYAGQSCISVQRIFVHERIHETFRRALVDHTHDHVRWGDPSDETVLVGPMIDQHACDRILDWITDAQRDGARVVCGGEFDGPCLKPTLLEDVAPEQPIAAREAFAPVAVLERYSDYADALRRVNATPYGLQAGVFTRDIERAYQAFEELEVGGVFVNNVPTFRVENMPYGGVKESGQGREGVRFAMEEMTELKVLGVWRSH